MMNALLPPIQMASVRDSFADPMEGRNALLPLAALRGRERPQNTLSPQGAPAQQRSAADYGLSMAAPVGDIASRLRTGMIKRGLPPHVADAFILNMRDESGLDPGIVERVPNAHGTRGFGLYQLTGPRRTAYERFAGERGVSPDDIDAQLDWMMIELEGPERRAAQSIFAAPDTGSAAIAIVNDFLRPAEQHRADRAARYATYR